MSIIINKIYTIKKYYDLLNKYIKPTFDINVLDYNLKNNDMIITFEIINKSKFKMHEIKFYRNYESEFLNFYECSYTCEPEKTLKAKIIVYDYMGDKNIGVCVNIFFCNRILNKIIKYKRDIILCKKIDSLWEDGFHLDKENKIIKIDVFKKF